MALLQLIALTGAVADSPPRIPVQGYLTDLDGVPLTETLTVDFALYTDAAGAVEVWSGSQQVAFEEGVFSVYLEEVDLSLFRDYDQLHLGMAVDGDEEMELIALATAPYAGYAAYAGDAMTLEGQPAEAFAPREHATDWGTLTNVPEGLDDGDDDALSLLTGCDSGQVLKWSGQAWGCAEDAVGEGGTTISAVRLDGTVLEIVAGDRSATVDLRALGDDADADPSNELNDALSLDGTVLRIEDSGGSLSVDLASLRDGFTDADADPTNELIVSAMLDGAILQLNQAGGAVTVDLSPLAGADNSDTNELNTELTLNNRQLSLTDAGGTLSVDLSDLSCKGRPFDNFNITEPGLYYLSDHLTASVPIRISASNVILDLNGNTLTGAPGNNSDGILLTNGGLRGVTIRNGSLRDYRRDCINGGDAEGVTLQNLTLTGCGERAVTVWRNALVQNVIVSGSGSEGIIAATGSRLTNCASSNNGGHGFDLVAAHAVDCNASSNGDSGFRFNEQASCTRCTADRNQAHGFNVINGGALLSECTSTYNSQHGFKTSLGNITLNSMARNNGMDGFNGSGAFTGCVATFNDGAGFSAVSWATFDGNRAHRNSGAGFQVTGTNNLLTNNWATLNNPNMSASTGSNSVGPIIGLSTTPAANANIAP